MKFAVDRIENEIVVLEDIITGEKKEVARKELPKEIQDGSIVINKENSYVLDREEEQIRRTRILEKLERLKAIKKE